MLHAIPSLSLISPSMTRNVRNDPAYVKVGQLSCISYYKKKMCNAVYTLYYFNECKLPAGNKHEFIFVVAK